MCCDYWIGLCRAYDRAAIKFRGLDADINFQLKDYEDDLKQVICVRCVMMFFFFSFLCLAVLHAARVLLSDPDWLACVLLDEELD